MIDGFKHCGRMVHGVCLGMMLSLVAGCAGYQQTADSGNAAETYVVARGDTLSEIAIRFGLDFREVAEWNQLRSPDRIFPGQRLRLTPPDGTPRSQLAASEPATTPTRRGENRPSPTASSRPAATPTSAVPSGMACIPIPVNGWWPI